MLGGEALELEIAIPQYSWVCTGRAKVHGPGTICGLPYRELVSGPAPGIGNPKRASARSPYAGAFSLAKKNPPV
jgi:hypothetical protein